MNRTIHKLCIWSVVGMLVTLPVGLFLAHLLPPQSPTQSAIRVARYYADHQVRVQAGLVIAMMGTALLIPFVAAMTWEVQKMTGGARGQRTVASTIQMIAGALIVVFIYLPVTVFMAATFRADRDPQMVQALNDLGWLLLITPVSFAVVEYLVLAVVMLMDKQAEPSFPRWFGYATLFVGFDFIGGAFAVLTETGPFAWNGAFAYWIPFVTFFGWLIGAAVFLNRSAEREWAAEGVPSSA